MLLTPVILLSLTIHEYSHALAADRLGDGTARLYGRLSLNPIRHLDLFGTILIFLAGFGWAKPVPVNPRNLENPRKAMMIIALAGPLSNIVLAVASGLIIRTIVPALTVDTPSFVTTIVKLLILMVQVNVALAVFNLIPLPPLDGSRILLGVLPYDKAVSYSRIEPYGVMILFALFVFGGSVFHTALWYPISFLFKIITGFS
jgi:Zn-dependent protease